MSKKSIRFFNDREVRAVWDDENNCWWFSATDVVRAINDEPDYTKAGNYWRWLKRKLKQEGVQLVSATHGFKFEAPDGRQRIADVLNSDGVIILAKHYPTGQVSFLIGSRTAITLLTGRAARRHTLCLKVGYSTPLSRAV